MLLLLAAVADARDGEDVWNSRCEECHGEPGRFAGKFLWYIDGQLQGRHHIDDLALFMQNHYIPDHEIDLINELLSRHANSMVRYRDECSECHQDPLQLAREALWITDTGVRVIKTGDDIADFVVEHRDMPGDEAVYYQELFSRMEIE